MAKTKQPTVEPTKRTKHLNRTGPAAPCGAGRRCGRSEPSGLARELREERLNCLALVGAVPAVQGRPTGLFQGIEPLPLDHDLQARPCRRRARQRTKAFTSLLTTVIDNAL